MMIPDAIFLALHETSSLRARATPHAYQPLSLILLRAGAKRTSCYALYLSCRRQSER